MEPTKPAAFQLLNFSIPRFLFEEAGEEYNTLDIQLVPSGSYNTSNGVYIIELVFLAKATIENNKDESKDLIGGTLKAQFLIDGKPSRENIPDFFYANSLAIVFPYLRAFISNLTLQAGTRLLILPLLNLSALTQTMRDNTEVFE